MIEAKLNGVNLFGDTITMKTSGPVADKFLVPPFSVLDSRGGDWKQRKMAWLRMGIKGEIGRGEDLTYTGAAKSIDYYRVKEGTRDSSIIQGTSIFDPMMCEVAYRWFCPEFGQIVDPFAGGSVRGVVASLTNRKYWGCDLRKEQIEANIKQGDELCDENMPEWICGDSMQELENAPDADFIFSCPPYGDLEKYSDLPGDLSNMEYHTFVAAYKRIILRSVKKLKSDSFSCFVVGDFRDKKGFYRNFVSETINAFEMCGAKLYNEGILITSVGSAAMRVTKQFNSGRKMCKTHQNVLVFCKGDWREAARKSIKGFSV